MYSTGNSTSFTLNLFIHSSHKPNCNPVQSSSGSKHPVPIIVPETSYKLMKLLSFKTAGKKNHIMVTPWDSNLMKITIIRIRDQEHVVRELELGCGETLNALYCWRLMRQVDFLCQPATNRFSMPGRGFFRLYHLQLSLL
jgi:hypothetical protein